MSVIKVLIVDDSLIFRHAVADALKTEPDIKIAGSVRNGLKAVEFIREHDVDIVTLDLEMPEMDGLETIDEIQKLNKSRSNTHKIGIVMLSALTIAGARSTIQALEKGAFDFITKPQNSSDDDCIQLLNRELVPRIRQYMRTGSSPVHRKTLAMAGLASVKAAAVTAKSAIAFRNRSEIKAILIGVSTGGPRALSDMLPDLCLKTTLPVLIVQHMPPDFTRSLAENLDKKCSHHVTEATDGERILNNTIYIAPGGRHMMIATNDSGEEVIAINDQPPENGCRPSVDILFRSAAAVYGCNALPILLTGMGTDGTLGIRPLKRAGAWIIAQDEASSVVWGMPGSAVDTGLVDEIVPLQKIPDAIFAATNKQDA